jgi:hypothetical protein
LRTPFSALLAVALALPLALAGCTTEDHTKAAPDIIQAVAHTRAMSWEKGNYWEYRATFHGDAVHDIALVVHQARADGFRLGSNLSSGFFGLPFSGNVSSELNPQIGPDEWPMFRFPLEDGKTWEYAMFGYDATTTAHATLIEIPGHAPAPGFRLESSSMGQVFARYDYSPQSGWFTRLELIEPTDRERLLLVELTGFGTDFGRPYYQEEIIAVSRIDHPTPPGSERVTVPSGYTAVHARLTVETSSGILEAKLKTAHGRVIAHARALGKGAESDTAATDGRATTWTLDHLGAGVGLVYLEVTGVTLVGGSPGALSAAPPRIAFQ